MIKYLLKVKAIEYAIENIFNILKSNFGMSLHMNPMQRVGKSYSIIHSQDSRCKETCYNATIISYDNEMNLYFCSCQYHDITFYEHKHYTDAYLDAQFDSENDFLFEPESLKITIYPKSGFDTGHIPLVEIISII